MSRSAFWSAAFGCTLGWLSACASAPPSSGEPASAATAHSSGAEQPPPAPVQASEATPAWLTSELVVGEWAEYWAIAGSAETQRYLFAADGSFVWRPAPSQAEATPSRSGRWTLEGATLSLSDDAGSVLERLALGECPPNREAEQLDDSYRCLSIGNQAFWRRDQP
jgi:hypothetical protein